MLASYQSATSRLLQNPAAANPLYATTDLTSFINTSRGQLAGEAECLRVLCTITTTPTQRNYNFANINIGAVATAAGVKSVLHVRRISYVVASGFQWFRPRSWEWFDLYKMNNPVPQPGPPTVWAQYGQGATGSFYIDPPPDIPYSLQLDCVCLPINLVDDATAEAIPPMWTDAVPFFAAYYALLGAQSQARAADANRMFQYYTEFLGRARKFSNPSVNRYMYEQSVDEATLNRLGAPPSKGGA